MSKVKPADNLSDAEKKSENENNADAGKVLRGVSSTISLAQSLANIYCNEWKVVLKERDSVYKQVIVAGLSNSRKNSKNK